MNILSNHTKRNALNFSIYDVGQDLRGYQCKLVIQKIPHDMVQLFRLLRRKIGRHLDDTIFLK